ncbi:Hypp6398 [Branchiostoma lanceolatum]|uniref:Hypp6398 protein n=1 Tax=Branchiostoma lanceolatum TaxID=7740 RepID=A0A8J9YU37_BRALA|nr:Hypp6398 [Branchiostoma lanceolatum]
MNSSKWWGNLWGKSKSKKQYKKACSSGVPPETEGEDADDVQDGRRRSRESLDVDGELQRVSPTNNKDMSRTMQGRIKSKVNPHLADSSNKIIRKSDSCPFRRNVGISNSGRFKEHKYRMGVFDRPDFFSDPSSAERQDRGSPRMDRSPRRDRKPLPAPLVTDL